MSETAENATPEPTESPVADEHVEEPTETPEDAAQDDSEADDGNPNREAAKYRRRLRDTEAERDDLAAQVDALRRQIVDDAVSRTGVPSEAFWSTSELGDMLDDDGNVDLERVTAQAEDVRKRFSIARLPAPNKAQGSSASGPPPESETQRWQSAFKR